SLYLPASPFKLTPTTAFSTLSLHDALPIWIADVLGDYSKTIRPETLAIKNNPDSRTASPDVAKLAGTRLCVCSEIPKRMPLDVRSEEHTSELQSRFDLVCRLLLEKKNTTLP